ncbi:T9SS type A sorting domain-containing protein [Lacinutrix sp. MEBiC02595]
MRKKYFICNCFLLFTFLCGYSQIVNEGILEIEPATSVYFENEYTNKTSGVHDSNGNLYLNNSFVNNGATSSASGTTYFKSAANPLLSISGSSSAVNFNNLEVDITAASQKGLSVADGFALNISNALNLVSGDVRLIDEAQLIQTHLGVNANSIGSGKILIDQQGYASGFKFNYWSAPVNSGGTFSLLGNKYDGTDASQNPFSPQQMLFSGSSPYNGAPSVLDGGSNVTTSLTLNTRWIYSYLQGTGAYGDWVGLNATSVINPAEGYTMKGSNTLSANQNYVYYGAPNNGEYLMPINAGEESLLGNPYPSALDATKFIQDNLSMLDALYFWVDGGSNSHATTDYLGGYAIRNLSGGIPPSVSSPLIAGMGNSGSVTAPKRYVPVGQGFFVSAYGSGSVLFNNSQRKFKTESTGDAIFYKSSEDTDEDPEYTVNNQYIRIGYEDPEGFHRQLLLAFMPSSTADINYNQGYDAVLNEYRNDDLFFVIEEDVNKKYAIQGLDSFNEALEFPLGLLISEAGSHQIMIDEIENFLGPIYLKDNILNTTHSLTGSSFNVNLPIGQYLDRYSIVFAPSETLSVDAEETKNIKIFYDGNNNIVVSNQDQLALKKVAIFNILGQEVLTLDTNLNNKDRIEIPFNHSDGIYLVKVQTTNRELMQKILTY